ncbi:Uncharacterised protein [Mycobacteroides abscessus subsp. massiliense]|nr:Uncharacterised protein [Mycobacteroides abscessus subsp. massiliense]
MVRGHGSFGVFGQPSQVARHRDRLGTKGLGVLDGPGNDASHQRDEQQHVDRGEPEAGEHVEGLYPVQPRADGRVFGQILVDLGLVERALRQHRAGDGTQCQQHQQGQRGAHRGQSTPGVARIREKTLRDRHQMGNLASETNESRTQATKSAQTPVISATPTASSAMPPMT